MPFVRFEGGSGLEPGSQGSASAGCSPGAPAGGSTVPGLGPGVHRDVPGLQTLVLSSCEPQKAPAAPTLGSFRGHQNDFAQIIYE